MENQLINMQNTQESKWKKIFFQIQNISSAITTLRLIYNKKRYRYIELFVSYLQNYLVRSFILFNLVFPMFKKAALPKLSSKNIKPLPLEFAQIDGNLQVETDRTIQTPKHQSYQIKDLQGIRTQKLTIVKRAILSRQKLPSLFKNQDLHKENLLDLDLCFHLVSSKITQTAKITERNNFVIKKVRTPSKSSKGKDTSAGSSDSSLEGTKNAFPNLKNETDSPQIKLSTSRGKSYTKHLQPCRIVNSKKLPFQMNPRNHKKRRSFLEEFDLDISNIQNKFEDQRLISLESYQNLCQLF